MKSATRRNHAKLEQDDQSKTGKVDGWVWATIHTRMDGEMKKRRGWESEGLMIYYMLDLQENDVAELKKKRNDDYPIQ